MLVTEEKPQSDVVIELIEQAVNDQLARVTFAGDRHQFVQAIAWNASRAAARELARRGLVNSLGPGQHAMLTVDPDRNHGRASITRGMVPINAAAGLLRSGDPLELVREEFALTEPEVAVVAALAGDFQDLAEEQLRPVYRERAQLVAVLAALFPAVWAYSDPAAPEWPVVYVDIPQGQCSWHLSADDLDLFGHVPQVPADDPRARWDGHTTDEKYEDQRADAAFLEEAIQHLRYQVQRACGGWTVEPSDEGRYLVGTGSEIFRETIIETHGPYAETIQAYLLTMDPWRVLSLLALLEDLQRSVSTGDITGSTRRAAVRYAEEVLGRKRAPIDVRRSAS